jgi:hypothetical protein
MGFDEFIKKHLDPDRVVYDCTEVEDIAREAWNAALTELRNELSSQITIQKLRCVSQKEQCEAKLETFLEENPELARFVQKAP